MSRFPTAGHLMSCAGLCPKSEESAGKQLSSTWSALSDDMAKEGGDLRDPRLRPGGAVWRGTRRSSAISIDLPA